MEDNAEKDRLKSPEEPPEERQAVQADDDPEAKIVAGEVHAESQLEILREEGELEQLP